MVPVNVETAWFKGTNIQRMLKVEPKQTRAWILREVAQLCKDIDAKKTLSNDGQIVFTCNAIMDEHPTLKVEELHNAFNMVRKGQLIKIFERLKTAEILEALRVYEADHRAIAMEQAIERQKKVVSELPSRKLEPLNLAKLVEDAPRPTPEGLGSRLRKKNGWDEKETHTEETEGETRP